MSHKLPCRLPAGGKPRKRANHPKDSLAGCRGLGGRGIEDPVKAQPGQSSLFISLSPASIPLPSA